MAVYPRASGGTVASSLPSRLMSGLSPRERGNRAGLASDAPGRRSIPARAGEPRHRPSATRGRPVYPRASGGTSSSRAVRMARSGLSPRERGNRGCGAQPHARARSIPARAGEPASLASIAAASRVYPRASGGTTTWRRLLISTPGLSPRERGNRLALRAGHVGLRSIPARAGEPLKKHFPAEGRCRSTANVNPKSVSRQTPRPKTMCAASASPNICRRHPQLSWEPRRVCVFVVPLPLRDLSRSSQLSRYPIRRATV